MVIVNCQLVYGMRGVIQFQYRFDMNAFRWSEGLTELYKAINFIAHLL